MILQIRLQTTSMGKLEEFRFGCYKWQIAILQEKKVAPYLFWYFLIDTDMVDKSNKEFRLYLPCKSEIRSPEKWRWANGTEEVDLEGSYDRTV